jgi:hypothetical protein
MLSLDCRPDMVVTTPPSPSFSLALFALIPGIEQLQAKDFPEN